MTTLAPTRTTRFRLNHGTGFWIIAAAFMTVMAFSTIPTPLYALYQERDGFATFLITVIFAAYGLGVMASLYLAGHVSDWLGRRRIILIAIVVEIVAAVVFLLWPEVPGLIVARFVNGVGVGMLTATATAHLSELRAVARPDEGPATSGTVSSFVNIGGLAVGALISGFLAQFVVAPLVVPYALFLVLLVLAAVAVAVVPETVERLEERPAYRPQRVSLPTASRSTFVAAGAGAFSAFAIFGLFTSLAPSFIAGTLHEPSRLVAGAVTFGVFGAAAVAQVLSVRMPAVAQLRLAVALMAAGLVAMAVGVLVVSLPVFVLSGIVAGAGVGILFRSSLGVAASLASGPSRGEILAATFLIAYAGMTVPVLLIGLALAFLPGTAVLVTFDAIVLVLVLVSGSRMIATRK
ncbi:MFS family permease [Conyzicola lurida]|uniref:MFS family permease n=1 Tax=Conyzicola lurida TaxID=1172621 RepID=A0A841AMY7_9MICO|nr:MFS transporter [Conyzicola lurida]MBB5842789.1 MFS family permease [Conyzicola lurida]